MIVDIKKLLSITLLIVFTLLTTSTIVYAAGSYRVNSNTNPALLTSQGTRSISNSGISFGAVAINMANTLASISATEYIRVDNSVTPKIGWHVNVSATDFKATIPDLSSAIANATLTVHIPASSILTIYPQAPTANGTVVLTGVTAQNTSGIAVTSTGVKVLSASATACGGSGCGFDGSAGYYLQQLNYKLTIPNYLPNTATISGAKSDSKFLAANRTPGAQIGLFAGTYSSTITYSISSGP